MIRSVRCTAAGLIFTDSDGKDSWIEAAALRQLVEQAQAALEQDAVYRPTKEDK